MSLCICMGVPSERGAGHAHCSPSSMRGLGLDCADDQVLVLIRCTLVLLLMLWMVDDHV